MKILCIACTLLTLTAQLVSADLTYIQVQCFDKKCSQDCDGGVSLVLFFSSRTIQQLLYSIVLPYTYNNYIQRT